jgi:hypothetical protein
MNAHTTVRSHQTMHARLDQLYTMKPWSATGQSTFPEGVESCCEVLIHTARCPAATSTVGIDSCSNRRGLWCCRLCLSSSGLLLWGTDHAFGRSDADFSEHLLHQIVGLLLFIPFLHHSLA